MTWQKFVYDKFDNVVMKQRDVFKRKRRFALNIPLDVEFKIEEIPTLNMISASLYSNISEKTIERDIKELVNLDILTKKGKIYKASADNLNMMMAKARKNKVR